MLAPDVDPSKLTDAALKEAFDAIDTDRSGTLEESELTEAIKRANPSATDETVKQLMKYADKDGDGSITFDEYCQIMRTGT